MRSGTLRVPRNTFTRRHQPGCRMPESRQLDSRRPKVNVGDVGEPLHQRRTESLMPACASCLGCWPSHNRRMLHVFRGRKVLHVRTCPRVQCTRLSCYCVHSFHMVGHVIRLGDCRSLRRGGRSAVKEREKLTCTQHKMSAHNFHAGPFNRSPSSGKKRRCTRWQERTDGRSRTGGRGALRLLGCPGDTAEQFRVSD